MDREYYNMSKIRKYGNMYQNHLKVHPILRQNMHTVGETNVDLLHTEL